MDRHLYSPEYERFALARDDQHASPYRLFMQHALAQRVAAAPVLACVHGGLLRRLQAAGLVPPGLCVVLPEPGAGGGARLPRTSPGPDPASAVTRDLLLRTLRLLLRSYWSWEWREGDDDGGDGGGFLACARAAAGATGRVSTLIGGVILQPTGRPFGDLDGAARALERLVALHPSAVTRATRDLGALRAHTGRRAGGGGGGDAAEAQRLLAAYRASPAAGADGPDDRDALDALIVALERRALEAAFAGPAGG